MAWTIAGFGAEHLWSARNVTCATKVCLSADAGDGIYAMSIDQQVPSSAILDREQS